MLIPTKENIQKLFETHQNQCAFSKCNKKIIDSDGSLNGNILFIESNVKGKPRFNPDLTNEHMIDYHNLILVCWKHAYDVEWKEKKYTISELREEIFKDLDKLQKTNFEFSVELFENILHHFIAHHDPDKLSHLTIEDISSIGLGEGSIGPEFSIHYNDLRIIPTKHLAGGKFEILYVKRRLQEFDKVVFYPKTSTYEKGIQADTEIMSKMRIEGKVPELPKGEYFVSLRSAIDDSSKLEEDMPFTVL